MKHDLNTDRELIKRLKKGDAAAFEIIYTNYYWKLYNFIREYIIYPEDCRDILQDVFTKLWLNREKLFDDSRIGSWLFTITRNTCLTCLTQRKSVKYSNDRENQRITDLNYNALYELELNGDELFDILDIFEKTFDGLTPQCKKVFEMSRFRNMNNNTIASRLSISVKTVESHMSRALKTLRAALSEYL